MVLGEHQHASRRLAGAQLFRGGPRNQLNRIRSQGGKCDLGGIGAVVVELGAGSAPLVDDGPK